MVREGKPPAVAFDDSGEGAEGCTIKINGKYTYLLVNKCDKKL